MTTRKHPGTDTPIASEAPANGVETDAAELPVPEQTVAAEPPVPESPVPVPVPVPATARPTGVVGPLLGGAIAAVAGFGLSHFDVFGWAPPDQSAEIAAVAQRLDDTVPNLTAQQADLEIAVRQRLDALSARVETLETIPVADQSGLAALDQRLQAIEALPPGDDTSTLALAARLDELEQRLASQPSGGVDQTEVDAALARLADAEAAAMARAAEAEAQAAAQADDLAQAQALDALAAAAASGAAFEAELAAVTDQELQAALTPHVAGVMPLAELQDTFPEAARTALQASRDITTDDGWGTRVVDFLAAQTGARPLTPQEGDGPEAVLSRADFALREGRLADALAELDTLDSTVRAQMEGWIAPARARLGVDAALAGAM